MSDVVDIVVLSRDDGSIHDSVGRALRMQGDIAIQVHRVLGRPRASEDNRWQTICRARNDGKRLGRSRWFMFLDDDVVLAPGTVSALLASLRQRPEFGAFAADYLGEWGHWAKGRHVTMGATLFRRQALDAIKFRWQPGRCECQCCCDDLRRLGWAIEYLPQATAVHLRSNKAPEHTKTESDACSSSALVLTAFDRNHFRKFRDQFLPSLRNAGNREAVVAVAYGLYPSQIRELAGIQGTHVVARPDSTSIPARRRLNDFRDILAPLPDESPVAYWDAGDVLFQGSIASLWKLVLANRSKLLVTSEPLSFQRGAMFHWAKTILDPQHRREAVQLLARRPTLNGGFAAGTAGVLRNYFTQARNIVNSKRVHGSSNAGDQLAMNLYCHTHTDEWLQVSDEWNYCLHSRPRRDFKNDHLGRLVRRNGALIPVLHGNARSLRRWPIRGNLF